MPSAILALALALQPPTAPPAPPVQVASASPAATPAAGMAAPKTEATPAAEPENPMDHVSCHYQEPEGSYFGSRKVCHTRREWLRLQHAG